MSRGTAVLVELEEGESHEFIVLPQMRGRSLAGLLAEFGLPLNTRCGQRGMCRGCEVHLREGKLTIGQIVVSAPAPVQACQARIAERVTVRIPVRSQIQHRPQVSDTFRIDIPCAHQPLFQPEPGGRDTAFVVDLGTTTVAVLLVDLATARCCRAPADSTSKSALATTS